MSNIAVLVTTFNRPQALALALPFIKTAADHVGAPIIVVDDGSEPGSSVTNQEIILSNGLSKASLLSIPQNRGLACALNIGFSYLLADANIEWISYFQDDVEVDPLCLEVMQNIVEPAFPLMTGHDAKEHVVDEAFDHKGVRFLLKQSIRATHMHLSRGLCEKLLPLPTRELGCPKRVLGQERGLGSNVDWVISDFVVKRAGYSIACIPGLVRTFLWKEEESCWGNTQKAGEDPPLSRDAIRGWLDQHL